MNIEIPERYGNTRAATIQTGAACVFATVVMLIANYYNPGFIHPVIAFLPAAALLVRLFLYGLLVNAFHEALRLAEADSEIDNIESMVRMEGGEDIDPSILNASNFGNAVRG